MEEIWRDVLGYEGLYQVSNLGMVKSLNFNKTGESKLLKPDTNFGYLRVCLCKNGIHTKYRVHRLVWEAFNGKIPEGMQINHNNELKTDNRLVNLSLMSPKENTNWGECISKRIANRKGITAKKKIIQLTIEGEFVKEWDSAHEIEKINDYSNSNIISCCKGRAKTAYGYIWRYK